LTPVRWRSSNSAKAPGRASAVPVIRPTIGIAGDRQSRNQLSDTGQPAPVGPSGAHRCRAGYGVTPRS
jgi:hypothetical protein